MPFSISRDDIARQSADAVVLPANSALRIDGGAGLAVGRIAGLDSLQLACDALGGCRIGRAVSTPAFHFPARYLVHAVGPSWDGSEECRTLLASAYRSALELCVALQVQSVVLPLLSAGAQGCPAGYSLHVALDQVKDVLDAYPELDVRIVLFSDEAAWAGEARFPGLESYIDSAYAAAHENRFEGARTTMSRQSAPQFTCGSAAPTFQAAPSHPQASKSRRRPRIAEGLSKLGDALTRKDAAEPEAMDELSYASAPMEAAAAPMPWKQEQAGSLQDMLDSLDASFSTTLLALIDCRGLTDAQVYKRANMSRQHFSKIRSNPHYKPTKKTVLALAVALELTLEETEDLLHRAGFALTHSSKADVIVEWFILQQNFDIFQINEALYAYDQPLLGQ